MKDFRRESLPKGGDFPWLKTERLSAACGAASQEAPKTAETGLKPATRCDFRTIEAVFKFVSPAANLAEIRAISYEIRAISYEIRAISYEIRAISYEIRAISYEIRAISYEIRAISYEIRAISYEIRAISYEIRAISYEIRAIYAFTIPLPARLSISN